MEGLVQTCLEYVFVRRILDSRSRAAGQFGAQPDEASSRLTRRPATHNRASGPARTLPRVEGENHELDWVRACKAGEPAGSHFEYAGLLTEICLLGNIAKRTGVPLQWDGAAMKFTNAPDANQFVHKEYRAGWNL